MIRVKPKVWHPFSFFKEHWPNDYLWSKQREMVMSLEENDRTVCPWANMTGKDYTLGRYCVYFFTTRFPCRVVTSSAKGDHLRVLWSEINAAIQSSVRPLSAERGGPLICNHQEIHKLRQSGPMKGERCPTSYMIGMVAAADRLAAMQGHHVAQTGDGIPRTLFAGDECSSMPNDYVKMASTWANRMALIGNTWPCTNFFRDALEGNPARKDPGGNIPRRNGKGFHRKVIVATAFDSPNVRLAMAQIKRGQEPTGEILVPGVKSWDELQKNLAELTEEELDVVVRAKFHKSKSTLMYPEEWLVTAAGVAAQQEEDESFVATHMGIDPGEGAANTVYTLGSRRGVKKQISKKTPEPAVIVGDVIALIKLYDIPPENVYFDRGGGGYQIASMLRMKGYPVKTVAFGDPATQEPRVARLSFDERVNVRERRYVYFNKRAEMYMTLRELLEAGNFGIPEELYELKRQLGPIPLQRDSEGRIRMLPKDRRTAKTNELTLKDLLGCSPDEADSTVLMAYGTVQEPEYYEAGAVG